MFMDGSSKVHLIAASIRRDAMPCLRASATTQTPRIPKGVGTGFVLSTKIAEDISV